MKNIKFINHACIQIFLENYSILIDPWFCGKVFNESWALLNETKIEDVELKSVKYIFISHEHPDHLNFFTLKKIYEINKDCTIIFPFRKDKTVKNVIEKIGFKFKFIKQNIEKFYLNSKDYVKYFSETPEGDHTILFKINDKIILNQNDDYTKPSSVRKIKKEFSDIDLMLTQFSLAGYYANSEDENDLLEKGHNFHLDKFKYYFDIFKPKIIVPFASYIYFCKDNNRFLNKYIVSPDELISLIGSNVCQLVKYNDNIYFENTFKKRNEENLLFLKNIFKLDNKNFIKSKKIEKNILKEIVIKKFDSFVTKDIFKILFNKENSLFKNVKNFFKLRLLSQNICIFIKDLKIIFELNIFSKKLEIYTFQNNNYDMSISSEDFLFLFKFPWGSDTINISSTVNHYSKKSFIFFYFFKEIYRYQGIQKF